MTDDAHSNRWTLDEAHRSLSMLVSMAAREPQRIYDCDRLVAAVIDAAAFEEFRRWSETRGKPSMAERFAELRQICEDEGYELEIPDRQDRPTAWDATPGDARPRS